MAYVVQANTRTVEAPSPGSTAAIIIRIMVGISSNNYICLIVIKLTECV